MSERNQPLSELVEERMKSFSGERGDQPASAHPGEDFILARVRQHYESQTQAIDLTDGLSMEFLPNGASTCAAPTPSRWCA